MALFIVVTMGGGIASTILPADGDHSPDHAPGSLEPAMTEAEEQAEIVAWFRETWPEHAMSLRVSQSGGFIGSGRSGAIRRAKIHAQGGVTGEADIVILLPKGGYGSLVIEHKRLGGKYALTPDQFAYIEYHNAIGNRATMTRGVEHCKSIILEYMNLRPVICDAVESP